MLSLLIFNIFWSDLLLFFLFIISTRRWVPREPLQEHLVTLVTCYQGYEPSCSPFLLPWAFNIKFPSFLEGFYCKLNILFPSIIYYSFYFREPRYLFSSFFLFFYSFSFPLSGFSILPPYCLLFFFSYSRASMYFFFSFILYYIFTLMGFQYYVLFSSFISILFYSIYFFYPLFSYSRSSATLIILPLSSFPFLP